MTTPPTPHTGALFIGVVHDYQAGCETTSLEEVLGQAMTRKDVGVEQPDSEGPVLGEGLISHRLTNPDFPRFLFNEYQVYCPDPGPSGLGKQFIDPNQEQADRYRVNCPQIDGGIGILEGPSQRVFDRFGLTVGQWPHRVECDHFLFQRAVEVDEDGKVVYRGSPGSNFHQVRKRNQAVRRRIPHTVTRRIASKTMSEPILE